jgi:Tfp pilus assembly protein PilO
MSDRGFRLSQNRLVARVLERVAAASVLVVLGLWLVVLRPSEDKLVAEQETYRRARQQELAAESRVARLEKVRVTGADAELNRFLTEHLPPRQRSFSKAADLVQRLTEDSGVQLSGVNYRLGEEKDEPLQRLGINVDVKGSSHSVLDFAHAVETTPDFLVVRGFNIETGDGGMLALRMAADLYLAP